MKKSLVMALCIALCAVLATSGTLAYLSDQKAEVNVMTLGSVYIEQNEQERDAQGNWVEFEQNKPLYPAVYEGTKIDLGTDGLITGNENVVDKKVTVTNTGKSEAYVRTVIAYEGNGDVLGNNGMIKVVDNQNGMTVESLQGVEINDVKYDVIVYTYTDALQPKAISAPSLKQLYMAKEAGNEYVAKFGSSYDVLVLSQAVQTNGFDSAKEALDTAFGAAFETVDGKLVAATKEGATETNLNVWFGGVTPVTTVSTEEELRNAFAAGGTIVLTDDMVIDPDNTITVPAGKSVTLDLGGNTLSGTADGTGNREMFLVKGNMTIQNGTVEMTATQNQGWGAMATIADVTAGGVLNVENATLKNLGGTAMNFTVHMNNWGEVTLNAKNAEFIAPYCSIRVFNSGYDMNNITLTNSKVVSENRALWVHNYTAADFGNDATKAAAAAARLNFNIDDSNTIIGKTVYGFTNDTVVESETVAAGSNEKLSEVITAGKTDIYLTPGTYVIPAAAKGQTLTISGTEDTVIDATHGYGQSLTGAAISFEGVTIKGQESGNYAGITHVGALEFTDCTFEGKLTVYSDTTFTNCTFTNMKDYPVWTSWGGNTTKFVGCTFNTGGKALLLYGGSDGNKAKTLIVEDCVFNSDGSLANDKAAIEIGNDYNATYELIVKNATVNGFAENPAGTPTGTTLWANKNSMDQAHLNVVVDNVDVY